MSVTDARGGPARECDPTAGAAISRIDDGELPRGMAVTGILTRPLTARERQAIRAHIDLEARKRARRAGAKVALRPEDVEVPSICVGRTEAGGRCSNKVQEGRLVCGVHRRQLAA